MQTVFRHKRWYMTYPSVQFDKFSAMGNQRTDFEACYEFTEKRRQIWGMHCHDFYELYVHLQGGHYYSLDQHIYEMHPNQLFIVPPFSMHGFVIHQELLNYERAFLYVSADTLQLAGCGQLDFDLFFQSQAAKGNYLFSMVPETAQKCRDLIIELKENQQKEGSLARHKDYALLLPILNLMCETVEQGHSSSTVDPINNIMYRIWIYVNEHYMEKISVDDLAKRFGLSYSYLSHEFKKYTNRSVYDYILYRRIMLAKKLIPDSDSMNTVAEQCGFDSYSNFLRIFNRIVGISPHTYKKAWGKNRLNHEQEFSRKYE